MDLQREKLTRGSRSCLVVRGKAGVVSTELLKVDGVGLTGVLTVHSPSPAYEGQTVQECEFLGRCYGENAFRAGHQVAQSLWHGQDGLAYDEMESWYYSRLVHEGS